MGKCFTLHEQKGRYLISKITNYGRPMKPIFIKIANFWARADNLGRQILGHLGYFLPIYQHPLWYCESLVDFLHQTTIISTKTRPLYPKYLFQIGVGILAAKN